MKRSETSDAERLRREGLELVRANRLEDALKRFDEARAFADDDSLAELITINKAGTLLLANLDGDEIRELPSIVMRRSDPRHTFLAAYWLLHKHIGARELRRAQSYGQIALQYVDKLDDSSWKISLLNEMGRACVIDSRNSEAIDLFRQVLALTDADNPSHTIVRGFAMQNLGYCLIVNRETDEGIASIHRAVELMREAGAGGYAAECFIDLCYGYLEQGSLERARYFGEFGLENATETRQIRNVHYLLGEVAIQQGDHEEAEHHFSELARQYPDFPRLKSILTAFDLRGVVNFKC